MKLENFYDMLISRLILFIGELSALIIFTALSVLLFVFRKQAYWLADKIGIDYIRNQRERVQSINSELLEIKGAFGASGYALYRAKSGKNYIDKNTKLNTIKIELVNEKPKSFFPDVLDYDTYKELIHLSFGNDWQIITNATLKKSGKYSRVLSFMEANSIQTIFSHRVQDGINTYGLILYTWNYEIMNFNQVFTSRLSKKLDYVNVEFKIFSESPFKYFL